MSHGHWSDGHSSHTLTTPAHKIRKSSWGPKKQVARSKDMEARRRSKTWKQVTICLPTKERKTRDRGRTLANNGNAGAALCNGAPLISADSTNKC